MLIMRYIYIYNKSNRLFYYVCGCKVVDNNAILNMLGKYCQVSSLTMFPHSSHIAICYSSPDISEREKSGINVSKCKY